MRLKTRNVCCAAAGILVITYACAWTPLRGQERGTTSVVAQSAPEENVVLPAPVPRSELKMVRAGSLSAMQVVRQPENASRVSAIDTAVQKYQQATNDADKERAKKGLATALSGYFDDDLKNREQELAEIEERVKKLRARLEKRRDAKEKLVELQLQVLINESEGLGFYSRPSQSQSLLGSPTTPYRASSRRSR